MKLRFLFAIAFASILSLSSALKSANSSSQNEEYFVALPYVQLGYHFNGKNLTVSWMCQDSKSDNVVFEYKDSRKSRWHRTAAIEKHTVNGHEQFIVASAEMSGLPADTDIDYRISNNSKTIFHSIVHSPPDTGKPAYFAVFGDVGQGTEGEAKIAALLKTRQPPLSVITGDIVYPIGTIRHYLQNFFPYLNSEGGKENGSIALASTTTVAVAGNHDITEGGSVDARDLDLFSDSLSYFVLWQQPLNGPLDSNSPFICKPRGSKETINQFLKAAGPAYPKMTNFSFDYGDCHFLVLDGNSYMDWTDDQLRQWVEADLKNAKSRWKFVAFHQPGFNSDVAHREEQRMRYLADIFERCSVDVCFAGHSHSYQRSCPLHFKAAGGPDYSINSRIGMVDGTFKLDKSFDGETNCKPDGVIYLVTGGGGAKLSHPLLEQRTELWLPFTTKFYSRMHSITFCHVNGSRLLVEQVAEDGSIVDQFSITK